jgi:hypothetical protein
MSKNRFEAILSNLRFTKSATPSFKDRFWQVREMIDHWNRNMSEFFVPSWVSCLDESMSTWINKYTCPGFMFVPRKPWPFGNEYHSICCGLCGIMYGIELVEGKDAPRQIKVQFDDMGKTVGLLLRLTERLWGTGKVVILDSGFCVLKGIVEVARKGVYAAALIKKRRYWPKHINGDGIKRHFADLPIGSVDALGGKLDGVEFNVFCMKEPDYTMMLMSTYGTNDRNGDMKRRSWIEGGEVKRTEFRYPEVVYNHYKYRHCVDDHNAKRHSPISIEVTWGTKRWECRVFAFLLAITEVNTMLAATYFNGSPSVPMLQFRKTLAFELLNNPYITTTEDKRKSKRIRPLEAHKLMTLPKGKKFGQGERMVSSIDDYPKKTCVGGHRKIRTYCACSPGVMRCEICMREHYVSLD